MSRYSDRDGVWRESVGDRTMRAMYRLLNEHPLEDSDEERERRPVDAIMEPCIRPAVPTVTTSVQVTPNSSPDRTRHDARHDEYRRRTSTIDSSRRRPRSSSRKRPVEDSPPREIRRARRRQRELPPDRRPESSPTRPLDDHDASAVSASSGMDDRRAPRRPLATVRQRQRRSRLISADRSTARSDEMEPTKKTTSKRDRSTSQRDDNDPEFIVTVPRVGRHRIHQDWNKFRELQQESWPYNEYQQTDTTPKQPEEPKSAQYVIKYLKRRPILPRRPSTDQPDSTSATTERTPTSTVTSSTATANDNDEVFEETPDPEPGVTRRKTTQRRDSTDDSNSPLPVPRRRRSPSDDAEELQTTRTTTEPISRPKTTPSPDRTSQDADDIDEDAPGESMPTVDFPPPAPQLDVMLRDFDFAAGCVQGEPQVGVVLPPSPPRTTYQRTLHFAVRGHDRDPGCCAPDPKMVDIGYESDSEMSEKPDTRHRYKH